MQTISQLIKKTSTSVACGGLLAAIGSSVTYLRMRERISQENKLAQKHLEIMILLNDWVRYKQQGKSMVSYFEKHNYRKIAIYGMSYVGETLACELDRSNISIEYGIDRCARSITADFEMITPEEHYERVDVIVVTAFSLFDEIKRSIENKIDVPIISIEDILYDD